MKFLSRIAAFAAVSSWLLPRAGAVVFNVTGDPLYNTTAPGGALLNSGWQYVGNWNGFVGTPISANQFITAAHVGGGIGNTFTSASGTTHTAVSVATLNDLAIWTVTGAFTDIAPIYTGSLEGLFPMTVFGRGVGRGTDFLRGDGVTQAGWFWGGNAALRWGTNVFDYATVLPQTGPALVADFDANGGADEATVANGDSGGATFIQVGGQWVLAGVVYGVETAFRTNAAAPTLANAAIYDRQGLFNPNGSATAADGVTGQWGQRWIASRISSQQEWILTQIPEPSTYGAGVAVAAIAARAWLRRRKKD